MHGKRIIATVLICVTVLSTPIQTKAYQPSSDNWVSDIINNQNVNKGEIAESLTSVDSIEEQIDELYDKISENVGIDAKYIKELYALAGGKAVYFDKKANIYNDLTVGACTPPMSIKGANTVYQKAQFIECGDKSIQRPSKYYLPDAMYSVAYDIKALMMQRKFYNRGTSQEYFDTLTDETKNNIMFYEAVLLYTGEDKETVDNLFLAYMRILTAKDANEYIIETKDNKYKIKDNYLGILKTCGFDKQLTLDYLAIMLSYDENIAIYENTVSVTDTNVLPYIKNYTSRENMMTAAMSLVGKVRYVWGGGHSGTSRIDGINPSWYYWSSLYPSTPTSDGFGKCIKSSSYWCPIHGYGSSSFHGRTVSSANDYLNIRKDNVGYNNYNYDDYMEVLSQIDYNSGVNEHLLDGLDCSGFASWLYNQITDDYSFDSAARCFTQQSGVEIVPFGEEMLPGDVFAWTTHIVVVVGKVSENSKAYVTVEQTPNVLRFGVIYYNGASSADIAKATNIANEANKLIGGLNPEYEQAKVHCMNNVGYYTVTETETKTKYKTVKKTEIVTRIDEETGEEIEEEVEKKVKKKVKVNVKVEKTKQNRTIGRFKGTFNDEDTIIDEYGCSFEDMTAQQIIEYTLTKLPLSYVLGYDVYDGDLFNKKTISSNIGITLDKSNK